LSSGARSLKLQMESVKSCSRQMKGWLKKSPTWTKKCQICSMTCPKPTIKSR
jgi:hypothetical protein